MKALRLIHLASIASVAAFGQTGTPVTITSTSFPAGTVGVNYSAALTASGGVAPYTFYEYGTLPPGLSLSGNAISGVPNTVGTYSFTLYAYDSRQSTATASVSITINQVPLTMTTTSVPIGVFGTPYSTTVNASGGAPPYTFSLGNISDGLSINATTGVISGTLASVGQYTLNVTVADSGTQHVTKGFTLNVVAALTITTSTLPGGNVGTVYPGATLASTGGVGPYTWTIPSTALPPGLTLNVATGAISGTPTTAGTYPFTVTVKDSQSDTATANLSITIGGAITITPATLPGATVGTAYTQTLTATGGTAPYTWSLAAGTLPAGLTLNATTGVISGTPTTPGSSSFTAQATDAAGLFGQARLILAVVGPVTITTTSLPDGTVGAAYSQTLAAAGGTTPYTWSISGGALPAGLTLNASTGAISGTPTATGTTPFTVTVTDARTTTARQSLTITVAVALTVTPTTLPNAIVGTAYTQKFTAAGGKAPYTFAITGTLPAGFTFTASTATISGTAAAAETGSFTLTATDASSRTATVPLTLTATVAPLAISPTTLTATVGAAFSQALTVTGGIPPYKFSAGLGNPPAGFSLNTTTGTISGTAPVAETGTVSVVVTDSSGLSATFPIAITANNPPTPTVTVTIGGASTSGFLQQFPVTIAIGAAYPVNIAGSITLTFAPSVTPATGVDDAMIQFSSGSRVINFTIPAGSTAPTLSNASSITVLTGTTAGTITLTTDLTAAGTDLGKTTKTIVNSSGVPFISSVTFQQTTGGVTVTVVGFSSTRDMVSGLFHFAPASNVTFTQADITVPLASAFSTWWSNTTQSNPYGTQFTLTMPFSTSTQSTSVVSVTVTLTNSKGASNAVTLAQ